MILSKSNLLNTDEIEQLYTESRRNALTVANVAQKLREEVLKVNSKEFRESIPGDRVDEMNKLVAKLLKNLSELDRLVEATSKLEMHMSQSYYSIVGASRVREKNSGVKVGR